MANINYNKVILGGRLTDTPELRQTNSGTAITSFGLAINRTDGKTADFFTVNAYNKTAELVCRFLAKGSSALVTGQVQNRSWQDKTGNKHTVTEIWADNVQFIDSKNEANAAQKNNVDSNGFNPNPDYNPYENIGSTNAPNNAPDVPVAYPDDEELPF